MPDIDLPANGEKPWGDKLNTALGVLNLTIDELVGLLSGGTTGQVLVKASDDELDAGWGEGGNVTGTGVDHIEAITRTAYDLLSPPDATTLYVIDESA